MSKDINYEFLDAIINNEMSAGNIVSSTTVQVPSGELTPDLLNRVGLLFGESNHIYWSDADGELRYQELSGGVVVVGTEKSFVMGSDANTSPEANVLSTPRSIGVSGGTGLTGGGAVNFDGSANAIIPAINVDFSGTGVLDKVSRSDHTHLSAPKWDSAITVSLIGDVTGSTSVDGSGNVSITTTVADDSHNHTIANVDGLQTALDGKQAAESGFVYGRVFHDTINANNLGRVGDIYIGGGEIKMMVNTNTWATLQIGSIGVL